MSIGRASPRITAHGARLNEAVFLNRIHQAHEYAITKSERQRIDEYVPSGKVNQEK